MAGSELAALTMPAELVLGARGTMVKASAFDVPPSVATVTLAVPAVAMRAADTGAVAPLRISFGQTLALVRSLWWMVALGEGILKPAQIRALTARTLEQIAAQCLPPRRARSCQRGLRKPVSSWPRLTTPTYHNGPTEHEILPAKTI